MMKNLFHFLLASIAPAISIFIYLVFIYFVQRADEESIQIVVFIISISSIFISVVFYYLPFIVYGEKLLKINSSTVMWVFIFHTIFAWTIIGYIVTFIWLNEEFKYIK